MFNQDVKISLGFLVVGGILIFIAIIRFWYIFSWSTILGSLSVAVLCLVATVWYMARNQVGIDPEELVIKSINGSAITSTAITAVIASMGLMSLLAYSWREVVGLILTLFFALFFLGFGILSLVGTYQDLKLSKNDPARFIEKQRRREVNARIMDDIRDKLDPEGVPERQWERRQAELREETQRWRADKRKRRE